MKQLTKSDILLGTEKRVSLQLKEYEGEILIRPLNDGELSKILSTIGPIKISQEGAIDLGNLELERNFEILRLAASMGMVEPQLTPDEVSLMKFGVPEYIGTQVLELSGVYSAEGAREKKENWKNSLVV